MDGDRTTQEKDRAQHAAHAPLPPVSAHVSPPDWFAAAAHDLRNPLAVIEFSAARLIADSSADRRIVDDGLQRILRSVHRAGRLVEDLLDAATRKSGTFDVRYTIVAAAQLLAEAKAAGEASASKASVTLEVQPPADVPAVRVDADRIAQVFDNLIGNATKFTPQGGRITVCALEVGDEVHFSIANSGKGVSEEDRTRVFAAYWQHDGADQRGRGLGLWISREIVEAHGGRIWIETGDAATKVTFALPSAEGKA